MLPSSEPERFGLRKLLPSVSFFKKRSILSSAPSIDQIAREAEVSRIRTFVSGLGSQNPRLALICAGIGGVSFLMAIVKSVQLTKAQQEIARRKEQLEKPIHELKGNEASNLPWNKSNIDEWLYRPIRITGRPLHNKAMLVPRTVEGYHGFDYIVPLVTKENEDGSEQEGILLNKGWIPHEYAHVGSRIRIENALPQTFDCYLGLDAELDEKNSFFKEGNAPAKGRNKWGHVYLPDMAKTSGFKNEETVKLALLERVNHNSALDERNPKHFEMSLIVSENYPYEKTRSGALQLRRMPWDLANDRTNYTTAGILFTGLAAALKLVR